MAVLNVWIWIDVSKRRADNIAYNAYLDASGLVQTVLLHVDDLSSLAVDTPRMLAVRVLGLWQLQNRKRPGINEGYAPGAPSVHEWRCRRCSGRAYGG